MGNLMSGPRSNCTPFRSRIVENTMNKIPIVGFTLGLDYDLTTMAWVGDSLRKLPIKRTSRNCRGKDDECQMWEKVL